MGASAAVAAGDAGLVPARRAVHRRRLGQARQGRLGSRPDHARCRRSYGYSVAQRGCRRRPVYFDTATMLLVLFTLGRYLEALGRARAVRNLAPLLEAEGQWARSSRAVRRHGSRRVIWRRELWCGCGRASASRSMAWSRRVSPMPMKRSSPGKAAHWRNPRALRSSPAASTWTGRCWCASTGAGSATRWAQIAHSVRDALGRQSPIQRVVDRVAGAAVPVVALLAAATALYWWRTAPLDHAMLVGLAVLVVACPCGLGFAAGLTGSLGIARLARRGCLVRGGGVLESLATVRAVAFDKTGTFTLGRMRLAGIETDGAMADEALARAAGLELHAEHRLAQGIVAAARERALAPVPTAEVRAVAGRGVQGISGGEMVAAGSAAWMQERGWPIPQHLASRARELEGQRSFPGASRLGRTGACAALVRRRVAIRRAADPRCAAPAGSGDRASDRRPSGSGAAHRGDGRDRNLACVFVAGSEAGDDRAAASRSWRGRHGGRRPERRPGARRRRCRHRGRQRHRSGARRRRSGAAGRRAQAPALDRRGRARDAPQYPHQPRLGFRLQYPCARPSP